MARRRVAVESGSVEEVKQEEQKETPTREEPREEIGDRLENVRRVKVVWGQETLSPAKFHVCVVGPYELEADVLEGEDSLTVIRRLQSELSKIAEAERERKLKSFIPNVATHKG